jgi:hypothetical protein
MVLIRAALGQEATHRDYLERFAADHKARRTFVQLLQAQMTAGA